MYDFFLGGGGEQQRFPLVAPRPKRWREMSRALTRNKKCACILHMQQRRADKTSSILPSSFFLFPPPPPSLLLSLLSFPSHYVPPSAAHTTHAREALQSWLVGEENVVILFLLSSIPRPPLRQSIFRAVTTTTLEFPLLPLYFLFRGGGGLRPSLSVFSPPLPLSATPWCIFNLRAVVSRRTQKAPFPPPFPPIRGVTP